MRRLDKEITEQQVLDEILQQSRVVRLAFSIDNIPHIVPVNFGYSENKLFIHSATEGNKIEMVSKNNLVCFEMELYDEIIKAKKSCGWTTKYRSIIGWGHIETIDDRARKIEGLNIIMAKYGKPFDNDYSDALLDKTLLLIVNIDRFSGKQSGTWE